MEKVNAFRISRILLTAHELRIATLLAVKGRTSSELAKEIQADPRATDRFLNALVALGLLDKKGGVFFNTPFSSKFLVESSPAYLGGLTHAVGLWRTWNTLTEAVLTGTTVANQPSIGDRGDSWLEGFIAAMHARAGQEAIEVADVLDLKKVKKILDVGGGSGAFCFEFVRRIQGATAVVFDLPGVVPITQGYIERAGMTSSVTTMAGDYLVNDFGHGYDLVFISAVVHINSPGENLRLIRKAAEALNPGGQVVIRDHVMSEDRTQPETGAIFALNMLVGTLHGDTYTENEMREWMEQSGLTKILRKETAGGASLMIGRKK